MIVQKTSFVIKTCVKLPVWLETNVVRIQCAHQKNTKPYVSANLAIRVIHLRAVYKSIFVNPILVAMEHNATIQEMELNVFVHKAWWEIPTKMAVRKALSVDLTGTALLLRGVLLLME